MLGMAGGLLRVSTVCLLRVSWSASGHSCGSGDNLLMVGGLAVGESGVRGRPTLGGGSRGVTVSLLPSTQYVVMSPFP